MTTLLSTIVDLLETTEGNELAGFAALDDSGDFSELLSLAALLDAWENDLEQRREALITVMTEPNRSLFECFIFEAARAPFDAEADRYRNARARFFERVTWTAAQRRLVFIKETSHESH